MPTLIAVFLFTIPLVVMVGNDDMASLPQTLWLQVAVPLLLTIWFFSRKASEPGPGPRVFRPMMALLSWSVLSTLWATDVFASERVLFRWIAAFGLAFLIANTIESRVHARRLLMALFWASVAVSAIGLLQHLGGWNGIPQAFPPAGTMGNKNIAAGFVVAMAPMGVVAFGAATSAASLIAMAVGMTFGFVLHTGCRAAVLALVAQMAVALWLVSTRGVGPRWRPTKWRALCAGASVFLWLATMAPSGSGSVQAAASEAPVGATRPVLRSGTGAPAMIDSESAEVMSNEARAERSVAIRLGVWRNSLEMIRSTPFAGAGIGNFSVHYPRFAGSGVADGTRIDERVDSAHNDYIEIIAELGLLGAGLLGWVALVTARAVAAAYRDARGDDRGLIAASGLGLVGLLVLAAVSPTVHQPIALVAAATFVGVTLRIRPRVRAVGATANERKEGKVFQGWTLGLIGASAAFVVASAWGFAQIRADRHVLSMAYAEARADWPAVVREGLIARRLSPGRVDPRFGTASALLRLGQAREAAEMLEELTAVDPYNANALGNLGIAYATLGDSERAAACFDRVLRLRPDDRFARARLGRSMAATRVEDSPS